MTALEKAIKKWWDDTIAVNDLLGSLSRELKAAGYVIVHERYAQSPPKLYRVSGEPQEQSARRDAE